MAFKLASVQSPHSLHPETIGSGRYMLQIEVPGEGPMLACYCPRNHVGAMYYTAMQYWQTFVPVSFGAFLRMLADVGVPVPESDDSRAWIEACGMTVIPLATRAH